YRLRRKNREIAQYVETVSELQLTLRTLPLEMASSVTVLAHMLAGGNYNGRNGRVFGKRI
ncbi:MAG: hypothetical protein IJ938_02305, partial [Clostridia bacterium]|nr:hypothetical protein [Clostridia bacterium]